jgi:hypothetical protein
MTLLKQFLEFINAQNDDKFIPQRSGWQECAVGQFASFLGAATEDEAEAIYKALYTESGTVLMGESEIDFPPTTDGKPSIMDFLNGRGYMFYKQEDGTWDTNFYIESSMATTFGELKQFANGVKPFYVEYTNG